MVLLGNLWLAGRLAPMPDAGGRAGGRCPVWADRLDEAAQAAVRRRRGGVRATEPRPIAFDADDIPDLTPARRRRCWPAFAVLIALAIAGAVAAAWETVRCGSTRSRSPRPGHSVTDPIFGKDIGFFLFELPFLRLVQALANGLLITTLVLVGAATSSPRSRGGVVFTTPVRVHLAVLGALFLVVVAFGYQLDKFELVYSTRGVATACATPTRTPSSSRTTC